MATNKLSWEGTFTFPLAGEGWRLADEIFLVLPELTTLFLVLPDFPLFPLECLFEMLSCKISISSLSEPEEDPAIGKSVSRNSEPEKAGTFLGQG